MQVTSLEQSGQLKPRQAQNTGPFARLQFSVAILRCSSRRFVECEDDECVSAEVLKP